MNENKLTCKQEAFAQNLFQRRMTQRQAYKEAYDASNMKDNTIDRNAFELARSNKITARIQELTDEVKNSNMELVEKVTAEFAHIAFDDISNYLDYRTEKTVADHDAITGEPIYAYQTIVDLKDSRTIDTRNIKSVSIGANGVFKFEQYCKDNALVQLGKHLGMFADKVELTGKNGKDLKVVFANMNSPGITVDDDIYEGDDDE